MREILFRGKATAGLKAGEFVYGYYAKDFWHPRKGVGILPIEGGYNEVDPETVGQYTGLTDKNGKKIFEGDIIEVDVYEYKTETVWYPWRDTEERVRTQTGRKVKSLWTVEYKEHRCKGNGFFAYGKDRRFNIHLTQSSLFNANPVVVGNIHDNPELLKGGEG